MNQPDENLEPQRRPDSTMADWPPFPPTMSPIEQALAHLQGRMDAVAIDLSLMGRDMAVLRDDVGRLAAHLDEQRLEFDRRGTGRPVVSALVGLLAAAMALAITVYLFTR